MSEKLCLQWNDFQDNIKGVFENLRKGSDFADVTLACEDGQQIEAHKVILAASSPFFQKLLQRNKHTHPLIYMRGMKFDDLLAIVDFLYLGEADVFQESLNSFLAIAEEFQLKGLMGKTDVLEDFEVGQRYQPPPKVQPVFDRVAENSSKMPKSQAPCKDISLTESDRMVEVSSNFSGDLDELDERLNSMMEKSENRLEKKDKRSKVQGQTRADVCKVCGKEGLRSHIKRHIEANHLQGIIIPCDHCDKTFGTRHAMKLHRAKNHSQLD